MKDYTELAKAVGDMFFPDSCGYCQHSDMCGNGKDCVVVQAGCAIIELEGIAEWWRNEAITAWKKVYDMVTEKEAEA